MNYDALCKIIDAVLPPNPPLGERPGYNLQWGGNFDGKDRVFVVANWGRTLLPRHPSTVLMTSLQNTLVAARPDLNVLLHYCQDQAMLIVQSE